LGKALLLKRYVSVVILSFLVLSKLKSKLFSCFLSSYLFLLFGAETKIKIKEEEEKKQQERIEAKPKRNIRKKRQSKETVGRVSGDWRLERSDQFEVLSEYFATFPRVFFVVECLSQEKERKKEKKK